MREKNIKTIEQLRWIGIAEGISYLVLLGIAMPLKYIFDLPLGVKITGWIHGLLFVLYIGAVLKAAFVLKSYLASRNNDGERPCRFFFRC